MLNSPREIIRRIKRRAKKSAQPKPPWRLSPSLRENIRRVTPFTMSDPLRLATLHDLASEAVAQGIPGDIVECGVCNGGSAALLATTIRDAAARRIWLYDTFEGIPPPIDKDGAETNWKPGRMRGSLENVQRVFRAVGFPQDRVITRQGLFKDTFQQSLPDQVAFLHIDADWYESVLDCLNTVYPHVAEGGIIVLDDFGFWEGCRAAFYDFCAANTVQPLLERVGYTQAFWRKGQTQTRRTGAHYLHGIYHANLRGGNGK